MARKNQTHYFISHLRRGLGAGIQPTDEQGKRATVDVELKVKAKDKDGSVTPREIKKKVALYGPGDVLGFDAQKIIARVQPTLDDSNFIANYIPFVEFNEPDFLWRYSAHQTVVNSKGKWIPWLTLIALKMPDTEEEGEFEEDIKVRSGLPRRIRLKEGTVLPNLSASWRWAHVYCIDEEGQGNSVLEKVRTKQVLAKSRLLCPRFLKAGTKYCAFVIPTYRLGVEAALGIENDQTLRSDLAWEGKGSHTDLVYQVGLPYYYRWEFRTGQRGDFEQIVRLIQPRPLSNLGGKIINIDNPGYGLKNLGEELRTIEIEGALQSSDRNVDNNLPPPPPPEYAKKLAEILGKAEATDEEGNPIMDVDGKPKLRVVPTTYGRWINHRESKDLNLNHQNIYTEWLETVNLDFRYRIAAGLGVQYIKEHQEKLMQSAWTQLEKVNEENRRRNRGRFAREVSKCLHKRLNQVKDNHKFLSLTEPVSSKLKLQIEQAVELTLPPLMYSYTSLTGSVSGILDRPGINTPITFKGIPTVKAQFRASDFSNNLFNPKLRKYLGQRFNRKIPEMQSSQMDTFRHSKVVQSVIGNRRLHVSGRQWQLEFQKAPNTISEKEIIYIRNGIAEQLNPTETIQKRLKASIKAWDKWELLKKPGKKKDEDPIGPAIAYPEFHAPMYQYLLALSEEYFVPGLDKVPQNTISALITNRKFIEAFMLGLNHEFASELRWRGYLTDMRGSYFRKFWDTTIYSLDNRERTAFRTSEQGIKLSESLDKTWEAIEDAYFELTDENIAKAYEEAVENWMLTREEDKEITPLDTWKPASSLGTHKVDIPTVNPSDTNNEVVLLIRAELLQKYPNTFIYLIHKEDLGTPNKQVYPIFEANLPPDIICLGFPFDEEKAREHFVVFEERLLEQRLGLDVNIAEEEGNKLDNLSWEHFSGLASEGYINNIKPEGNEAKDNWDKSTFIAKALTQKQVRMAVDLDSLLP